MATGILSIGAGDLGLPALSSLLLAAALAAMLWLGAADLLALLRRRAEPASPPVDLFTWVAATGVVAARLDRGELQLLLAAAAALGWLAAWVALIVALSSLRRAPFDQARGSWLLLVVAPQSLAILAARLLPGLAVPLWLFGLALYVPLIALIVRRLPAKLEPDYWIMMGALAISTLAAVDVLGSSALAVAAGLLIWTLASAWLPLLFLAATPWRGLPRYDPLRWSLVFPIGMYGAASHALYVAGGGSFAFLDAVAKIAFAAGLLAWLLSFSSWIASRRPPHAAAAPRPAQQS